MTKSFIADYENREVLVNLENCRVDENCKTMIVEVVETNHPQGRRTPFEVPHSALRCDPAERELLKKAFNLEVIKKKKQLKRKERCRRRQMMIK